MIVEATRAIDPEVRGTTCSSSMQSESLTRSHTPELSTAIGISTKSYAVILSK